MKKTLGIEQSDFERADDDFIQYVTDYIGAQRTRLYINNRKHDSNLSFPKEVDMIYCLFLFYSSLTLGDFDDRTLIIPKMEYNIGFFWKFKDELVHGLKAMNLEEDASFLEKHLTGAKITKSNEIKLDMHFWNVSYKMKLKPNLVQFVVSKRDMLIAMQDS